MNRFKKWLKWRKKNKNRFSYKLKVLFERINSPSFDKILGVYPDSIALHPYYYWDFYFGKDKQYCIDLEIGSSEYFSFWWNLLDIAPGKPWTGMYKSSSYKEETRND